MTQAARSLQRYRGALGEAACVSSLTGLRGRYCTELSERDLTCFVWVNDDGLSNLD